MHDQKRAISNATGVSVDGAGALGNTQQGYVIDLSQVGKDDLSLAGGKGANLGELIRAGLPVPSGFVVTTTAYDRFVQHNHLDKTIAQALSDRQDGGTSIRVAFESAEIPAEIEREVVAAYQRHGVGAVAVRSSATAEDLPEAAFAGQQDTILNIISMEDLLHAVRSCWASLWTDRAITYRERRGVEQQTVKLAVVVQRLIAAEAAGVMFTANPVTGARDEMVIDASPGLGEAVVSGLVTPDHIVLDKRSGRVKEQHLGQREVIIRALPGGGTESVDGTTAAGQPVLPARALRRLARLGTAIEQHFGGPYDIEWAWARGEISILQARPITALPEPPPHLSFGQRLVIRLGAEVLPLRPYPLDATTWTEKLLTTAAGGQLLKQFGIQPPPFEQMFVEEDGVIVRLNDRLTFHVTPAILPAPLRLLRLLRRYHPGRWQADPLIAEAQRRIHDLEARNLRALSWQGVLVTLQEALAVVPLTGQLPIRYYPRAALALGLLRFMLTWLGKKDRFGTLLSGVETMTTQVNRALEDLAAHIRSQPLLAQIFATHDPSALWDALEEQPAGRAFLDELHVFLDRYGHRETTITVVSQPTWKDAPEIVLGMLKGLAAAPAQPGLERSEWEEARDEVLAHPLLRLPWLRALFLDLLTEARQFAQLREGTHFYITLPMPVIRRCALELAHCLQETGVVDTPEEIFHFKLNELTALGTAWPPTEAQRQSLRALVQCRAEKRAMLSNVPLVDPRLRPAASLPGQALLRGTPASPGIASGPVRIIRSAAEFGKLQPGDILVAPYTNPAWTPLFQQATAVVVDTGGAISHAAIIAREYGIPAVMGTIDGTRKLQEGQPVIIDGNRGLVLPGELAGLSSKTGRGRHYVSRG